MTKVEALKQLAVALGCATEVADVTGETSVEVLMFITANYESEGNIPTKVSQLENDSGFITKTVSNLTKYTKTEDLPKIPTAPTDDGVYQLTVADGVASWTEVETE
ncbi:MAG: hypothetical protein MJY71_08205 [Bacteroidaceae bacterium]|nr:hypothetical protein [Bacteroidaceae bacterium]